MRGGSAIKRGVIINEWWSKILMFSQLDTALSNKLDSLGSQLVSLDTLMMLERLYRKNGFKSVRNLLSLNGSGFNCSVCVWIRVLSSLFGERWIQRIKNQPRIHICAKEKLESCIMQILDALKIYTEKKLESCIKTKKRSVKKVKVRELPFVVLYHTFLSPIIREGRKPAHKEATDAKEVSIEEMLKEIEAFKPDRYMDFPLW